METQSVPIEQGAMPEQTARQECQILIREMHHQVKNHLQVLVSLFSLQAHRTTQPEVLALLGRMQNRVRAIAQIHEAVSRIDHFSVLHFGEYLHRLASGLESFYDRGTDVRVQVSAADLVLPVDQAMPLALISNELLCNAFEHAFPDGRRGTISVALRYNRDGFENGSPAGGELQIVDDGIGLPQKVDVSTADSLGLYLVRILTQQVAGQMEVHGGSGTTMRLAFPLPKEWEE